MSLLTASYSLRERPQCPICRDYLVNNCWQIVSSVAICRECAGCGHLDILNHTVRTMYDPIMQDHVAECDGIRFCCPPAHHNRPWAIHLIAAERHDAERPLIAVQSDV